MYKKVYNRFCNFINAIKGKLHCFRYLINPSIHFGKNVYIGENVKLQTLGGGEIIIGNNVIIHDSVQLLTRGGNIIIGDNSSINPFSMIYGGAIIGTYVRIGTHSIIIPSNHVFKNVDIPIAKQGIIRKGICIEDDVWIGASVNILDGVKIGKGTIIGSNSTVTKNIARYSVAVGCPAVIVKSRL